jgi:hypothetical protein
MTSPYEKSEDRQKRIRQSEIDLLDLVDTMERAGGGQAGADAVRKAVRNARRAEEWAKSSPSPSIIPVKSTPSFADAATSPHFDRNNVGSKTQDTTPRVVKEIPPSPERPRKGLDVADASAVTNLLGFYDESPPSGDSEVPALAGEENMKPESPTTKKMRLDALAEARVKSLMDDAAEKKDGGSEKGQEKQLAEEEEKKQAKSSKKRGFWARLRGHGREKGKEIKKKKKEEAAARARAEAEAKTRAEMQADETSTTNATATAGSGVEATTDTETKMKLDEGARKVKEDRNSDIGVATQARTPAASNFERSVISVADSSLELSPIPMENTDANRMLQTLDGSLLDDEELEPPPGMELKWERSVGPPGQLRPPTDGSHKIPPSNGVANAQALFPASNPREAKSSDGNILEMLGQGQDLDIFLVNRLEISLQRREEVLRELHAFALRKGMDKDGSGKQEIFERFAVEEGSKYTGEDAMEILRSKNVTL